MRAYELMIIFDGDVDDTAVNEHLANVSRLVEAGGGTVVEDRPLGSAPLRLRDQPQVGRHLRRPRDRRPRRRDLAEVERVLHLADEVVRHKIIRLPDARGRPPRPARRGGLGHGRVTQGELTMAPGNTVTLVGNCTRDPELRFTLERPGGRHLRPRGQPSLAEPPDQRVGRSRSRSSTSPAGSRWPRTWPSRSPRAAASSSPAASSSAPGRPRTATSARRSRSSPTRSARACAGPPLRSSATSAATASTAAAAVAAAAAAAARPAPRPERGPGRVRHGRGAVLMAKAAPKRGKNKDNARRSKKKISILDPGEGRVRRLQGRQPAPPVHVRPGQDPRPSRHRQRLPAAEGDRPGHQERP